MLDPFLTIQINGLCRVMSAMALSVKILPNR